MKRVIGSLAAFFLLVPALAAQQTVTITVTGGKDDLKNTIVAAPLPAKLVVDAKGATVTAADGKAYLAQLAPARLQAADQASASCSS